ncbi:DNA topoisomerase IB [Xanthomonas euvesicatoria pv. eucalypti]|uniref:DNA topoisomerase IB n=1 Tax=Xanthomonas euvesicatoria TaxID=456327 RepID=UPI0026E199E2|nr:DNA topoisomerase IB [Xanthomonas euvesicatoria]MDO7930528.1 DNA topoisomerase IB [Xanthomonas euvesicatoria pv. eucalypti]MDO7934766.1 DNA topoisomerase IB [Xanthomonas euvesicatoria pv. eucalypti]MDO7938908.1 DNA topoisomerase IB [Xanthomonas euvesicatoria pv. eucalypti]MDO7943114.1 DNA topoisomerase IB [Xanthomonas euvesicatoria pv. eucalypti]MDO7949839.1 DNA topoisomerase IB [Xanthomonas euvesicatoria pv. eucalypti]
MACAHGVVVALTQPSLAAANNRGQSLDLCAMKAKRVVRNAAVAVSTAGKLAAVATGAAVATAAVASAAAVAQAKATARAAGLTYVNDQQPGISRRKAGKSFSYRDADGQRIADADTLQRIRSLAIPPAYTDVWICAKPNGHLQATGRDARRRKQYRYHADWAQVRGEGKFERVIAFGTALPKLRRRLRRDLVLPGFPREKVLAIVVALLADTLVRVGNAEYARSNRSYGLTTLRNRHMEFLKGGRARLKFRGKSGQDHDIEVDDKQLVKLIRQCQQLPGQSLFQYRDDDGQLQPVDSGQVNDYLREAMGEDFTAKDFRTWGGTLAALQRLARVPLPERSSERALKQVQNDVIREVADALGNTPSVCRKAYIDPCVFEGWRAGQLQAMATGVRGERQWEAATLKFLSASRSRLKTQSTSAARRKSA